MAVCMRNGICSYGLNKHRTNRFSSTKVSSVHISKSSQTLDLAVLKSEFKGRQIEVSDQRPLGYLNTNRSSKLSIHAQGSVCVSRAMRWWDKTLQPNMIEINSAQEFVETLQNAGNKLVIVDFYSPGCGGCKSLHPKICQIAESNPDALFLKVNFEELKNMCYILNIHVLPFFRFYRGAEGRLCSFSCTNATIKKFRDALGKHGNERCSLGPAKGLEEAEIMKLASGGEISPVRSMSKEAMEKMFNSPTSIQVVVENAALV